MKLSGNNHAILYNELDIALAIKQIAGAIDNDYRGKELHIVAMLNGASFFCVDLVRQLTIPVTVHYFGFTSYQQPNLTGEVCITKDVAVPLQGKHILILEGVIVSGRTPKYIFEYLQLRKPDSVSICAIGIKRKSLATDLEIKYACFDFNDEMVVGYGIGAGEEKNIPYLINSFK